MTRQFGLASILDTAYRKFPQLTIKIVSSSFQIQFRYREVNEYVTVKVRFVDYPIRTRFKVELNRESIAIVGESEFEIWFDESTTPRFFAAVIIVS